MIIILFHKIVFHHANHLLFIIALNTSIQTTDKPIKPQVIDKTTTVSVPKSPHISFRVYTY